MSDSLQTGKFYGKMQRRFELDGVVLTEVSHACGRKLPCHTHESAYFGLLLAEWQAISAAGGTPMPRSIYLAVLFAALAVFEIEKSPRVAASASPKPLGSPEFAGDGKL